MAAAPTGCSTAAGPAFEGAGLSMGMAGKTGAVDHVR
ncbi:ASKHA domain-containing protein, partial [uncultured Anaerotruncus sp.]